MMSVQGITGKLQLANTPFQPTQLCFSLTAPSCATFNGEIMRINQSVNQSINHSAIAS